MGDWQKVVGMSGDCPEGWFQEDDMTLDEMNEFMATDEDLIRSCTFSSSFEKAIQLLIPDVSNGLVREALVREAEKLIRNYVAATEEDRANIYCLIRNYAAASEEGRESISRVAEMAAKLGKP